MKNQRNIQIQSFLVEGKQDPTPEAVADLITALLKGLGLKVASVEITYVEGSVVMKRRVK